MKKFNFLLASYCLPLSKLFTRNCASLFFILIMFALNVPFVTQAQNDAKNSIQINQTSEIYSRVKVTVSTQQFTKMNELLGFDHIDLQKDGSFIGEFSQSDIAEMIKTGAKIKVLIPDLEKNLIASNNKRKINNLNTDLALPTGFTYGSMGGYLTYAELTAKLDLLHTMYPSLVSEKISAGKSTENRDLWYVRISNNPGVDQDKPKVFYNALTHAREPAGMMSMFYYMCTLLQNYYTDPEAKFLIDNRELYFMPCVNPDGYEYNRSTNPNGGGMWRKNRYAVTNNTITVNNCHSTTTKTCDTTWKTTRTFTTTNCISTTVKKCDTSWNASHTTYTLKNCHNITTKTCDTTWKFTTTYTTSNCINKAVTTCDTVRSSSTSIYGVDLNRNFGYKWGYDNTGSSATNTSDTYRGPSAFSEPETKAVRDFSILKNFKMVSNQHTYGNQLTYPYSYADAAINPDQALFDKRNSLLTEVNSFLIGHMHQTAGYLANGEASDWQYGEQTTKSKAFSWSPELGGSGDGFWPALSRIEPLSISMLRTNLNIAWIAGEYFRYSAPAGLNASTTNFTVPVTIINYGEQIGSVEKINFISSDTINIGNDCISLSGVLTGATVVKNLAFDLSAYSGTGTINGVLRITYTGGYTEDKPYSFTYSLPASLRSSKSRATVINSNEAFTIFPNPTSSTFYVSSKNNETPVSISVYSINGSLMKINQNVNEVDLSDLSNGIYTIRIETANGFIDKKITKQ